MKSSLSLSQTITARITILERQSYVMLFSVAAIIIFGFFVSERSPQTTAADLNEVQRSAESVRVESQLENAKIRLLDVFTKMNRLFDSAASRLQVAVNSAKADAPLFLSTYFFRTDFQHTITELNERGSNSLLIPLSPLPQSCLNVLTIALKRPPEDYFLFFGDDLIVDFPKHINDLAYVAVTGTGYPQSTKRHIEKAFEPIKANVIDAARHSMDTDCAAINNSPQVKSFYAAIANIDVLYDRSAALSSTRSTDDGSKGASDDSIKQSNIVYLLAINRFGPLVVVFFVSSLIITLYKYNSRLVGFYRYKGCLKT